jgi:hypothetical protein
MRKQILFQLALLLLVICTVKAQAPTNGLVEHFTFDNTFSGVNGGLVTATANFVDDRGGTPLFANNFAIGQGTANVTLTGLPTGSTTRTIAFWVSSNSNVNQEFFNYGSGAQSTFAISYNAAQQRLFVSNFQANFSVPFTFTTNWRHVAVTFNGTTTSVYVDGALAGGQNLVQNTSLTNARIGVLPNGTQSANFKMDDLFIYNRALSAPEVMSVMTSCLVNSTTPISELNKCINTSSTLSVSNSNITWYDAPTGGNLLSSSSSFTTEPLSSTTLFYAQLGTCTQRKEFSVNISAAIPAAPTNVTPSNLLSVCNRGKTTLTVSSNSPVNWFDVPNAGNSIGTGNTYVTPTLISPPNNFTFYAQASNACGASARTPIIVTIDNNAVPTITNTSTFANTNLCFNGPNGEISVSSPNAQFIWFSLSGGAPLDSTNTLNTLAVSPQGSSVTAWEARAVSGVCVSAPVTIITYTSGSPINIVAVSTNNLACPGGTTTLSATASASPATFYWYDAATGGNLIGIGSPFTTPAISVPTSFYVQSGQGACASSRREVQVGINPVPSAPISIVNDTIKATNLFNGYVLRRDGNIVAQSTTTGTISYPVDACGDYQASFTNTVNNCPNRTVGYSRSYDAANFACRASLTLNNFPFPVKYTPNFAPFYATPTTVATANPISFVLRSNTPNCSNNSTLWYVSVEDANGCVYNFTVSAASGGGTLNVSSTTDTVTTCAITSNIVTATSIGLGAPTNTTSSSALSVCSGNATTLTASGSGTLFWFDVPTGGTDLGSGNSFNTGTLTGNKTFYVQSGNGVCASSRTAILVSVNSNPIAAISPATSIICNGQSATLTASGGGTYAWSNNGGTSAAATFSPTTNTTYTVTVTANGCSATASRQVTVNANPTAAITPTTVSICNGATATLTASGGGTYSWSNSGGSNAAATFSPTTNTTYSVTITNTNNCSATASQLVTVNANPTVIISPANVTICDGQSATLTANGGATFAWSNSGGSNATATFSPTTNTTYTVTVTNASNCTATASRLVTVNANPTVVISPATAIICNGASATLTASGGSNYTWSNNGGSNAAATFSPTTNTTYTVTVIDANNCSATVSRQVTVNALPIAAINPLSASICSGTSQTLTASGGGTYVWSNSETTAAISVSPMANTTYTVTVTNANNCSATASINVTVNTVTASINGPTTICTGLNATLTASGGSSYVWSNSSTTATITVSPLQATTYGVTVMGAGNCTATASQTVNVQGAPTATISGNTTICNGESTTLTANGGNTYTWSNGDTASTISVNPTSNTTYTVTVSIGANCTASESATVTVNQPSSFSINETICFGDTYDLNGTIYDATNIYTQTLTNDAGCDSTITLNLTVRNEIVTNVAVTICNTQTYEFDGQQLDQDGNYSAVFTAANSCDSTVNLVLTVVSEFTETVNASICEGDSYEFNGQQLTITDAYTATFVSSGGCDSIVTLNLTVNPLPQPTVTANNADLSTEQFSSYQWLLNGSAIQGADQQNYTASQNGDYSVKVTDANGCENTGDAVNVTTVGINDYDYLGFTIYPNPTTSTIYVETKVNNAEINIISLEGRVLMNKNMSSNKTIIDISSLAHGMYIIEMKAENNISRARVVKE